MIRATQIRISISAHQPGILRVVSKKDIMGLYIQNNKDSNV